jgi:hypothetical protein
VEAMNADGEMYGYENFTDAILRHQKCEPRDMVDNLLKEIAEFTQGAPQSDDITVLVLQHQKVGSLEIEPEEELLPLATAALTASVAVASNDNPDDDDNINWI